MMPITEIRQEMEEYAASNHVPIIKPAAGRLLEKAVSIKQPSAILEIGTAIGYSALLMAGQAPATSKITTIEQDEARVALAQDFWQRAGLIERINVLQGDAGVILPCLKMQFDLVFIDAAKGQYLDYLNKVMDKLTLGAVVIADNVLFRGFVSGGDPPRRYRTIVKRLRAYLEFVQHDPRFVTKIYDNGDGMAISYYQGENV
jgi:predicted O-methyltransferase YrrM